MPNILQTLKEDHFEYYSLVLDIGTYCLKDSLWTHTQKLLPPDVRHKCFTPELFTLVSKSLIQMSVYMVSISQVELKVYYEYKFPNYIHAAIGRFLRAAKTPHMPSKELPGVYHECQAPMHTLGSETTAMLFGKCTIVKSEASDIYSRTAEALVELGAKPYGMTRKAFD